MKKSKLMYIFGIVMLPILFAIFLIDRVIGSFLFWMPLPSAVEYFDTTNHFITSLYRIGAVSALFGIYQLVIYLI